MKNIVLIFSLLLFCVSCKEEALQKMRRADSIMNSNCDSALVLLSQIDGAKLCSNSGRAYYALLLTEARYKNFIPLENDSLISIATEYYSKNNDSHLYGRALMYRGCALFEAMDYNGAIMEYKKAELEFEKDTNFTMLGLINTRLGEIYEKTYEDENIIIERYSKAAQYFKLAKDSLRTADSYKSLGRQFIFTTGRDSAEFYLKRAISYMPQSLIGSDIVADNYYLLMNVLISENKLEEAKEIGLLQRKLCNPDINNALAEIYIKTDKPDSALILYNDYKSSWTELDKLIFLKKYNKSLKNFKEALLYEEKGNRYADSITEVRSRANLSVIEHKFDYTQKELEMYQAQSVAAKRSVVAFSLAFLLTLAVMSAFYLELKKKKEIQEYILYIDQLKQENKLVIDNLSQLKEENNNERRELYLLLGRRFGEIQNILDISYQHIENPITFVSKVKTELSSNKNSDALLDDLCKMVDRKYNGALSTIKRELPYLSDSDMRVIALYCENFSVASIAFLFNTTPSGIHAKKYRLMKKMGITGSIENFVQKYSGTATK